MRRLLAGTATVLVVLLLPLALVSTWLEVRVADTDRWVSTVGPLASDPEVKKAVIALLQKRATEQVDDLTGGIGLGDAAVAVITRSAATAVVNSPAFRPAWEAANRSAHAELIRILEDDGPAARNGRVSVELGTVLNTVFGDLERRGLLPATVPEVRASFALADSEDVRRARFAYRSLHAAGFWLPILTALAAVVALVFSATRWRTVRRISAGAVAGMMLVLAALAFARAQLAGGSPDEEVAGAVWDVVVADLEHTVWAVGAGALVVLLVAAVGRRLRAH